MYAERLGGRRHCEYGTGVRVFNQEKRVGTAPLRLKTDLEVRLGHGVRWRMLAKFRRETLHGFEQSAAVSTHLHSPAVTSWIETRRLC